SVANGEAGPGHQLRVREPPGGGAAGRRLRRRAAELPRGDGDGGDRWLGGDRGADARPRRRPRGLRPVQCPGARNSSSGGRMSAQSSAEVVWEGTLAKGSGKVEPESGAFRALPVDFDT